MRGWFYRAVVVSVGLVAAQACSSDQGKGGAPATGGIPSSTGGAAVGGATGTGGVTGTGGATLGQGGTTTAGGSSGSGGATGDGGRTGTGGAIGSGGKTSMGGTTRAGGAMGTGGRTGTGGATASGGLSGTGGAANLGGAMRTGGATGSGGTTRSGGASGTGGATRSGGASGTGGATGSGGTTGNSPYKGVANSPAAQIAALGATWCYNWGTKPQASDCDDPYFVPMVWGKDNVASAIKAIGDAGYKVVLGFNEPNKSDQANMTVDEAIALWPTLTSNPNIRVGSPAVSDDGRAWLESFMTQVQAKGLRVDFIAMHWYGWNAGSCVSGQLEGAVNWASKWGLPVWITEFGCMGSSNPDEKTVLDFFNAAIPMLQKKALVERYAWYPWNTYNHLYETDAITALGQAFAAAPPYRQ